MSSQDYNILLLSDFLYGGRAIAYALLALSDPVRRLLVTISPHLIRLLPRPWSKESKYTSSTCDTGHMRNTTSPRYQRPNRRTPPQTISIQQTLKPKRINWRCTSNYPRSINTLPQMTTRSSRSRMIRLWIVRLLMDYPTLATIRIPIVALISLRWIPARGRTRGQAKVKLPIARCP